MPTKMVLTGDINLMNVTDPTVPFSLVENEFRASDLVFCNLECCLYEPPSGHSVEHEGFYADPTIAGEALKSAGIHAVGVANNVNYGEAAITGSIARLDELGIAHTGAGASRAAARAPAILERDGVRFGFLQRSSVYWATNHEAGENTVGIAVIRGHTAYHVPLHGGHPPANRPGIPPEIVTWADRAYLQWLEEDIAPWDPEHYRHNSGTGEDNAAAHLRSLTIGHEVIVPVTKGRLDLGPWQRIFYGEWDGQRPKRVILKAMGM